MVPNLNLGRREDDVADAPASAQAGAVPDLREAAVMPVVEVTIPKKDLQTWNRVLRRKTPVKDAGPDEVLHTVTAKFADGHEADIKVCNGRGPYLDPVLFNQHGYEVECLQDCSDRLDGTYEFRDGFTVKVAGV